jgi:hypothetical protein
MRLDDAMPRRERHGVPCDASPAAVTRATEEVTWREVPVFWGFMTPILIGHARLRAIRHRVLLIDRLSDPTQDHRKACVMRHEQRLG